MKRLLLILLAAALLLAGAVTFRTLSFVSRQIAAPPAKPIRLDTESMVGRLAKALQYRTVSDSGAREFQAFQQFLANSFPKVQAHLSREIVGGQSLLYAWKGTNEQLRPMLLMAHMDVVPVEAAAASSWTHPPFSGQIAGAYVWGRGAMDDKVSVLGIFEALEQLLAARFTPQRTAYFAFGHDEETGGSEGAAKIAQLLRARKVELEYILDEGGNIADGIVPDVSAPVALVGIAEKGYVSLELTVETGGGHASVPPRHTAIGILSSAVAKLEGIPFPSRLDGPTRQFFDFIGPEMSWLGKAITANLWLFDGLLQRRLEKSPLTDAMIRTTQAATVFESGVKENVLPTRARAVVNFRILSRDSVQSVLAHVRKTIADPRVKIAPLGVRQEPSPITDPDSRSFRLIHKTIRQVIPGSVVAPALLVAATDSRHYASLSKNVFRFLPITVRAEDARRFHGIDERISIKDYERCVRFYIQLIRNSQ
jgi:carboxypeptidase PM20D1